MNTVRYFIWSMASQIGTNAPKSYEYRDALCQNPGRWFWATRVCFKDVHPGFGLLVSWEATADDERPLGPNMTDGTAHLLCCYALARPADRGVLRKF